MVRVLHIIPHRAIHTLPQSHHVLSTFLTNKSESFQVVILTHSVISLVQCAFCPYLVFSSLDFAVEMEPFQIVSLSYLSGKGNYQQSDAVTIVDEFTLQESTAAHLTATMREADITLSL